MTLQE